MSLHTLFFADLVDSTALVARLGDARAAELWAEHDSLARSLLAQCDGHEIDRSDGFFILFGRPEDAARFASGYHRLVAELGMSARVGLHHASVTLRRNPRDQVDRGAKLVEVDGLAKPLAARIMMLAGGGRTLLSSATVAALGAAPLEGLVLRRHGHYRFKGVEEPVEIAELAAPPALCTPPADGEKAYRVVRAGEVWLPVREVRHNLTAERDPFVGRHKELSHLVRQFEGGTRLLTVLGPGGTGKTRLVRRYAMAWLGEWPGGVYFCDLSDALRLEQIHAVVALTMGVPLVKDDAGVQLGHAIAGRGRCLVILDNFEQVQSYAPATVGEWLDRAAQAHFVVTSREKLHLAGEVVFALDPLALADDAIALFAARAQAQQQDFIVDAGNRDAVAEIVRLLDGLPLAIELAAARVRVLAPTQIVARMKDRFSLLSGARGVAARQATLRAAIDWSWELLEPWEQAAMAQCSVFDGGFTLEAAETVVALCAWPEAPPVLDTVQGLVDKSLLRSWLPKAAGRLAIAEPFFGMYLSIHDYASQKLRACGDRAASDAEQRHGRYFGRFGDDQALDALLRHGAIVKRQMLALELDNLVGACRRATQRGQSELAAPCFLAAWSVLEAQGPFSLATTLGLQVLGLEGLTPHHRALLQVALAHAMRAVGKIETSNAMLAQALAIARESGDCHTEAIALRYFAVASHRDGHVEEALRHFDAALALHQALNDRPQLGALHANFANLQMELGKMVDAKASYEAALALHREAGNRAAEGIALGNLATLHHELGRIAEARADYESALLIHRDAGNLVQEAITLCNLGILVSQQGEHRQAAAHCRRALQIHRDTGNRRGEGVVLGQIGQLHHTLGEFEQARVHYDDALRIHREVGNRRFEGGALGNLGELLADQGQPDLGLQAMEAGERLLREVDDPLDLAKLLCTKGRTAMACGSLAVARAALVEAEQICLGLGAESGSDLGQQLEALRGALA